MNKFDDIDIDDSSFAWRDLQDLDVWTSFDPVFGALTVVGTPAYKGRYRFVGRQCFAQVQFSASTSIASTAGVDYLKLPAAAQGLSGHGIMSNDNSNVAVGNCHIDVSTSRCYLPSQVASGNVFNLAIWFET